MNFGEAIEAMKAGKRVTRTGWNGKNMWLVLVTGCVEAIPSDTGSVLKALPWIGMKTATDCFVPWLASQTDVLAEDWQLVSAP